MYMVKGRQDYSLYLVPTSKCKWERDVEGWRERKIGRQRERERSYKYRSRKAYRSYKPCMLKVNNSTHALYCTQPCTIKVYFISSDISKLYIYSLLKILRYKCYNNICFISLLDDPVPWGGGGG